MVKGWVGNRCTTIARSKFYVGAWPYPGNGVRENTLTLEQGIPIVDSRWAAWRGTRSRFPRSRMSSRRGGLHPMKRFVGSVWIETYRVGKRANIITRSYRQQETNEIPPYGKKCTGLIRAGLNRVSVGDYVSTHSGGDVPNPNFNTSIRGKSVILCFLSFFSPGEGGSGGNPDVAEIKISTPPRGEWVGALTNRQILRGKLCEHLERLFGIYRGDPERLRTTASHI